MAIRVVLAEDSYLLREGLARLLDRAPEIGLVGTCGSYDELIAAAAEHRPDVVITDIRMPPTQSDEGIRAAAQLRTTNPDIGVVVLSQFVSPAYALALLADGTSGRAYLLKDRIDDIDRLVDAVKAVHEGGSVIDSQVVEQLVQARSQPTNSVLKSLTPRELEILREIATGKSNAAIAATVFLSERAIEKHTNSIFSKLGITAEPDVNRRVTAVLLYLSAQSGVT
jgi:DNA-binding NarL/FixJ family response regulator